jgi:pyruvate dehydrogenase complex dehydrogenase (E1) component
MLVLSTVEHNYLVVDVCYLLHKYQLHVSALMAIFRFNELTKNFGSYIWHASYIRWRGFLLDGGTRSRVYWVGGGVYMGSVVLT